MLGVIFIRHPIFHFKNCVSIKSFSCSKVQIYQPIYKCQLHIQEHRILGELMSKKFFKENNVNEKLSTLNQKCKYLELQLEIVNKTRFSGSKTSNNPLISDMPSRFKHDTRSYL